jgi:arabinogalactan endo-1,4-beta-galactosidase
MFLSWLSEVIVVMLQKTLCRKFKLEYVYDDIQRANDAGLEVFLIILSKRIVPDKWKSLGLTVLKESLVSWTRTRLEQLADNGLLPTFISVGDEINIEFLSQ